MKSSKHTVFSWQGKFPKAPEGLRLKRPTNVDNRVSLLALGGAQEKHPSRHGFVYSSGFISLVYSPDRFFRSNKHFAF